MGAKLKSIVAINMSENSIEVRKLSVKSEMIFFYIFFAFLGITAAQKTNYDCGRATPQASALVVGGLRARHGELPWHIGIYKKTSKPYKQICGGSLVSHTLIISAAHCFWDPVTQTQDAANYAVAGGKIFRPWDVEMDIYAQRSDVREVLLPELFRGEDRNYAEDIALVVMVTPFQFRPYLRPVCLDFDPSFESEQLISGNIGMVAGWGLTAANGAAAPVLQVAELPYLTQPVCLQKSPKNYWEYITFDKICAGIGNGSSTLCQGDSGGGLVFPYTFPGVERFYLRGVVSTSPTSTTLCNVHAITSFTKISSHRSFIESRFDLAEDNQPFEPTSVNISNRIFDTTPCILPEQPQNARYETNQGPDTQPGDEFSSVMLRYTCALGYAQLGDPVRTCANGVWSRSNATCVLVHFQSFEVPRACLVNFADPSTEYFCNGSNNIEWEKGSCNGRQADGATVNVRCRTPNYYFVDALDPNHVKQMICVNQTWQNFAFCDRNCGLASDVGRPKPQTKDGVPWSIGYGEFPWHVGVYRLVGAYYVFVCGGSLINNDLVLTAAHCFWDDENSSLWPVLEFAVSGAKKYKEWYEPKDGDAQRSEIDRVVIPDSFRGEKTKYADDIALVFLARPFKINRLLRPVCLDFTKKEPTTKGILVGMGVADDIREGRELYAVQFPAKSNQNFSECSYRSKYLTQDKFCGHRSAKSICHSGAGGGLVYPHVDYNGIKRYYLRGVSVGLAASVDSDDRCWTTISTFTSLHYHASFILKYYNP